MGSCNTSFRFCIDDKYTADVETINMKNNNTTEDNTGLGI